MNLTTVFLIAVVLLVVSLLTGCAKPAQPFGENIWRGYACVKNKTC